MQEATGLLSWGINCNTTDELHMCNWSGLKCWLNWLAFYNHNIIEKGWVWENQMALKKTLPYNAEDNGAKQPLAAKILISSS